MTVHVQLLVDDVWGVRPEGRIDIPTARAMEDGLNDLLDQGHNRIVVDLAEAVYITSGGLRVLLKAKRRAQTLGGDVHLAALNDRVRDIVNMAGFDQVFTLYTDSAEAARSYGPVTPGPV
jgi:anti-sigma B factor antagonist